MKKNHKIVKFLCIILAFSCLLTSFSFLAYTVSLEKNNIISIADCETLATYWLSLYYNDDTTIGEIIPIFDGENICSYCVSFISNNSPNGYIVIDSDKYANNNIAEFSFSDLGIYETLCENSGKSIESSTNKVIYSTGLFDYAISVNCDNTLFYNSTNEFFNKQEIEKRCKQTKEIRTEIAEKQLNKSTNTYSRSSDKETYYNGFFNGGELPSSGSYTQYTISSAASFTPSTMGDYRVTNGAKGNCTATAAANLLSYYKEKRGFTNLGTSRQAIYNQVVSASGWDQYEEGGMSQSQVKKGIKTVVNNANYSFSSNSYLLSLWSNWTNDLDDNYPVLTFVFGYRTDENNNWIKVGHAIVAIGYREYSSGANYLRVLDGWNRTSNRYIYFNSDYFSSIDGMRISISN